MEFKRKPQDYPQFYCRMSKQDKLEIEKLLNELITSAKQKLPSGAIKPKRNQYIVDALKLGLTSIRDKLKDRPGMES